jgi:hypothetical protein
MNRFRRKPQLELEILLTLIHRTLSAELGMIPNLDKIAILSRKLPRMLPRLLQNWVIVQNPAILILPQALLTLLIITKVFPTLIMSLPRLRALLTVRTTRMIKQCTITMNLHEIIIEGYRTQNTDKTRRPILSSEIRDRMNGELKRKSGKI